jgi:hypothetical protein
MNHWPFIIGAYGLAIVGIGGAMLGAFLFMRRAEKCVPDRR